MTDIDFDELDRAVNSLMNQRQQNSDSAQQSSASESTATSDDVPTHQSAKAQEAVPTEGSDQTPAIGPMPSAPQDTPAFVAQSPDPDPAVTPEPVQSASIEQLVPAVEQQSPGSAQPSISTTVPSASEPVAHDEAPLSVEQRQVKSDNEDTTKTIPEPIVPKRTGRIMDVMPPSPGSAATATPIISRAETAAVINRTNAAVDTMVTNVTPHASDDKPAEAFEKPEADIAENGAAAQSVASSEATASAPSMTETIAQSLADSAQSSTNEPQAQTADVDASQKEQTESLESPFLSNTIVKKRPLGVQKEDAEHAEQALAGMLDLAASDEVPKSPTDDISTNATVSVAKPRLELTPSSEAVAAAEEAPVESSDLDRELMALEMGIVSDLAEAADTEEPGAQSASEDALATTDTSHASDATPEATPAPAFPPVPADTEADTSSGAETLELPAGAEAPSVDAAPSIPNEAAALSVTPGVSTAPEPVPMFDVAATQPQPMEEKKSSGFLTFVIVLILLLLGAGGGAAAYYFLLVQ